VNLFTGIAEDLRRFYQDDLTAWASSPFLWIRQLSAKKKGAAMEALVKRWANAVGFEVRKSPGSESDCRIGGALTEIKGSTLWDSGDYQFNQIRKQDYSVLVLLGLSPHKVDLWCIPKEMALKHVKPQHGGALGQDTFFLKFPATAPPHWMWFYGGSPAKAAEALKANVRVVSPQFPFSHD
jgi:hypothetical protein